jgi:hypothetical protein
LRSISAEIDPSQVAVNPTLPQCLIDNMRRA